MPSAPPSEGLPIAWFALFRERHSAAAGKKLSVPPTEVSLDQFGAGVASWRYRLKSHKHLESGNKVA